MTTREDTEKLYRKAQDVERIIGEMRNIFLKLERPQLVGSLLAMLWQARNIVEITHQLTHEDHEDEEPP